MIQAKMSRVSIHTSIMKMEIKQKKFMTLEMAYEVYLVNIMILEII